MRRSLVIIAAAALFATMASAQPPGPIEVLVRAEAAVEQATSTAPTNPELARELELEAIALYQSLVTDHGVDTPAVHRNLGVLRVRTGELGRGIASLKRAQRLDPTSVAVADSLAAARARVRTAVDDGLRTRAVRALFLWRGVIPARTMVTAAVALWTVGWLLLTLRLARRLPGLTPAATIALAAAVLLTLSVALEGANHDAAAPCVIVAPEVIARRGPSEAIFEPVFDQPLREGVEAQILEERAGWARLRLASGNECWVPLTAIERV